MLTCISSHQIRKLDCSETTLKRDDKKQALEFKQDPGLAPGVSIESVPN